MSFPSLTDPQRPTVPSVEEAERFYQEMLRIRLVENTITSLFLQGHIPGTMHLCTGQEATPVAIGDVRAPQDIIFNSYRGDGYSLAFGMKPAKLLAERMAKATGSCGGRASGMNMFDLDLRIYGAYAIIGGVIGAATGSALASKLLHDDVVTVSVFGDGATNQAYFHECLNFASVKKLSIVYVCENNLYAEYTSMFATTAGGDLARRAASYGIATSKVDGNDVFAVRDAAREAFAHARSGAGPAFIEALTYRHVGHSRTDPGTYRPPEELQEWLTRDPLSRAAALLSSERIEAITREVEAELAVASLEALEAPFPDPESLKYEDLEYDW